MNFFLEFDIEGYIFGDEGNVPRRIYLGELATVVGEELHAFDTCI